MTLYLKYRPQKLHDLDMIAVRESLQKIVKSGKIPHAFLFAGPKGTGKTSAARILAKVVNCEKLNKKTSEPCNKCAQCRSITKGDNLDVIELDAASHRGIDDIRSLRDAVKLSPVAANRKVYIIDEAHMLTTEASNALLKTLEEPPEHVMFILATTNPERLIPTILSRSTIIRFTKATTDELVSSLTKVIKGEKVKYEKDALELIARASDGSFRDATKILEQILGEDIKVNEKDVEQFLYKSEDFDVDKFIDILINKNTKSALNTIENAVSQGITAKRITETTIAILRDSLLVKEGVGDGNELKLSKLETIQLIKVLTESMGYLLNANIEQIPLEIAVIEWCGDETDDDHAKENKKHGILNSNSSRSRKTSVKNGKSNSTSNNESNGDLKSIEALSKIGGNDFPGEAWKTILRTIRPINSSTEALLRASKPIGFDGKTLTLGVFYRFHKEKLESHPHINLLEETITETTGKKVRVNCILTKPPAKTMMKKEVVLVEEHTQENGTNGGSDSNAAHEVDNALTDEPDDDIINAAKEIFGN
jgi:DNA polymerase-3 subunit gamma/tau